jgi:glycosyltransferase involved in cell wall biosynthesis
MSKSQRTDQEAPQDNMREDSAGATLDLVHPEGLDFSLYIPGGARASSHTPEGLLATRMAANLAVNTDLLVDIGAGYGQFSVAMAQANPDLDLIAIGSAGPELTALEKNLENLAAGGRKVRVLENWGDLAGELGSYFPSGQDMPVNPRKPFFRIADKGNELEILNGLKTVLKDNEQAVLLIKLYPDAGSQGGHHEKLFDLLYSLGYKLYGIDEEDYRYYPLDKPGNLGRLSGKYGDRNYYMICMPDHMALSVVFFAHDPLLSGASRSLLDLMRGLSEEGVLCTAVVPSERELTASIRLSGIATLALADLPSLQNNWLWADASDYDIQTVRRKFSLAYQLFTNYLLPVLGNISPDLVYSQTVVSPWGALAAGALGLPHILSAREYGKLDHNLNFHFGFEQSVRSLYDSAEAVFCVSDDVRKTLFGFDEGRKARVIYSGIQLDPEYPANFTDRAALFHPSWERGVKVGIFGTVMERKGQEDLVMACLELLGKGYNIHCLLAGHISDREYLMDLGQRIEDAGYSQHFQWLEFSNNPYQLMQQVDIVVSCSRLEALGRTVIEASLLSRPFIFTRSGGFTEVYQDGVHALSYEPGDYRTLAEKIVETIDNPEDTTQRISRAREYVSAKFNRKGYTRNVLGTLRELGAGKTSAGDYSAVLEVMGLHPLNGAGQVRLIPKVYYSEDAGRYTEKQSLKQEEISPGYFSAEFDLGQRGYPFLRLDPVEGSAAKMRIYLIEAHSGDVKIPVDQIRVIYSNGERKDEMSWTFYNKDPQVHFEFPQPVSRVRFTGELYLVTDQEYIDYLTVRLDEASEKVDRLNTKMTGWEEERNTICFLFMTPCLKIRRILFKMLGVRR